MQRAYNAGFDAFERGDSYANPYEVGTTDFNWFERGYFQALKRSTRNQKLTKPYRSWSFYLLRDAERHMKAISHRANGPTPER